MRPNPCLAERSLLATGFLAGLAAGFLAGLFGCRLVDQKVIPLGAGFDCCGQPAGLSPSPCPGVPGLVPVLDGHLAACQCLLLSGDRDTPDLRVIRPKRGQFLFNASAFRPSAAATSSRILISASTDIEASLEGLAIKVLLKGNVEVWPIIASNASTRSGMPRRHGEEAR